jgi:hypothetical protein
MPKVARLLLHERRALASSIAVTERATNPPARMQRAWAEVVPLLAAAICSAGYSEAFAREVIVRLKPLFMLTESHVDPPTAAELGDYAPHAKALAAAWPWVEARYNAVLWQIMRERLDAEILNCVALGWKRAGIPPTN